MSRISCTAPVFMFALFFLTASFAARAADDQKCAAASAESEATPWYWFNGSTNNHPAFHDADRQVDRELNRTFRLIAPGFDDVRTFTDQANDMMIWTPFIGVGRKLGIHWDVFFQAGGSAGKVRTEADDISFLLLPFHSDVEIKRSSIFIGPGISWYPFGFAENYANMTWRDRISETKPFIFATLSYNRLGYEANIKAGLRPFGNFIQNKQEDTWHAMSSAVGAGVDIPLTKRTTLALNAQYVMFYDYAQDFNGPAFAFFFKRAIGGKDK